MDIQLTNRLEILEASIAQTTRMVAQLLSSGKDHGRRPRRPRRGPRPLPYKQPKPIHPKPPRQPRTPPPKRPKKHHSYFSGQATLTKLQIFDEKNSCPLTSLTLRPGKSFKPMGPCIRPPPRPRLSSSLRKVRKASDGLWGAWYWTMNWREKWCSYGEGRWTKFLTHQVIIAAHVCEEWRFCWWEGWRR